MIRILCIGRIRAGYYRDAAEDYQRRLRRLARIDIVEIPDSSEERQAEQILEKLGEARVLACDAGGDVVTSEELSEELGSHGAIDFLIGGPDGLGHAVITRADRSVAFGRITLPHELARVVLLEQIYRGFTILKGHPYHR